MRKMSLHSIVRTLFLSAALALSGAAWAQTNPANDGNMQMPKRGETKASVEQRLGAPDSKVAAVGEPPISRWVYPTYTVYFEFDRVLNFVDHQNYGK